jgi:hypothetical protein
LRRRPDDPTTKERSDEARHHDKTAIRLGCKLRMGLLLSSADRFGAGWINDSLFRSQHESAAPVDAHT